VTRHRLAGRDDPWSLETGNHHLEPILVNDQLGLGTRHRRASGECHPDVSDALSERLINGRAGRGGGP